MHPSFEQMLEQAKHDPTSVNFSELRLAYTETPAYSPHQHHEALYQRLGHAMEQQDWSMALQLSQELLEQNYLDIKAHLWAKTAYEQLQQNEHAWFHYRFANALIDSIKGSGDGTSPQTAFELIDANEKWAFLESQGYQFLSEQRHPDRQHIIEIVDVRDAHQQSTRLFFNLDATEDKTSVALDSPRKLSDFGIDAEDAAFSSPSDDMAFAPPAQDAAFSAPADEEEPKSRRRRRRRRDDEDEEESPKEPDKSFDLHQLFKDLGVPLGANNAIYTPLANLSNDAQKELSQLHQNKDRMKVQKGAGWFLSGLGLLFGLGLFFVWFSMMSEGEFRNGFVIITILFATFAAMSTLWGGARLWNIMRSRVGSFFYPHTFYLIRTEFDQVEAWPYVFLYPDACRLTHHTTDGNYNYSDLQLNFLGYGDVGITFHDMHQAEDFLGQVFQLRADAFADLAESDFTYAEGADLMKSAHGNAPLKQNKWKRPLIWAAVTGVCLVVGYPLNNYFLEEKDWNYAVYGNRRSSYEFYLRIYPNGRYAKDARLGIDNAAFESARKAYTAVNFRRYINEFPQGQHLKSAREMLADLYDKAISRYKAQIGTPNRSTGLILKILEDLKKNDNHTVFVRFTPRLLFEENKQPNADKVLDLALKFNVQPSYVAALKRKNSYIPAPIKPAFRPEENASREQYIVKQLDNAFRAIVPQGIMDFMRIHSDVPPGARVVFDIKYDIRQKFMNREYLSKLQRTLRYSRSSKGRELNAILSQILNNNDIQKIPTIYVQTRSKSYGRYRTSYNTGIKTPVRTLFGVEMDWSMDIKLTGTPAEKFTFASDAASSIRLGGNTSDPIDVYRQIAQSAFQRFSAVLQKQFGVHNITPSYNSSRYNSSRYNRNRYRRYGRNSYRYNRGSSYRPPTPPSIPSASPLSAGVGTPTGSSTIDRFVNAMPASMRSAYMAQSHFKRRMSVIRLWTQLDRMYFRLPFRIRRRYRRYSIHDRRVRMLRMLDKNKNRRPLRRRRPRNDDPFGP